MTCSFESNLTKPAPPPPASNLKSSKKVAKSKPTEGDCTSEVKVEAVPEAASLEDGHDSGVASSYEDHHQVWSLTQLYSVDFSQSRMGVKSAFSSNAQSRFAFVVFDGVLGPPRLVRHT